MRVFLKAACCEFAGVFRVNYEGAKSATLRYSKARNFGVRPSDISEVALLSGALGGSAHNLIKENFGNVSDLIKPGIAADSQVIQNPLHLVMQGAELILV